MRRRATLDGTLQRKKGGGLLPAVAEDAAMPAAAAVVAADTPDMPSPAKRRRRGTLQSAEQRPALLMGRGAGVESHQLLTLAKLGFS
eukprot:gene25786-27238_t